jgi:hypothetical protein
MLRRVMASLVVLAMVAPAHGDPVTVAVGGMVAQKVIDRAGEVGKALLGQAERTGSALATRLGNELNVAAANAALLIGKENNKAIDALDTSRREALLGLSRLTESAEGFVAGGYELKDAGVVDLTAIMDITPFAKRVAFMVQRIDGIVQMQSAKPEYRFGLLGLGFGTDSSVRRGRVVGVSIAGKPVIFRENKPKAHYSEILIPAKALNGLFPQRTFRRTELKVVVEVAQKGWFFWGDPVSYSVPFDVALFSTWAGEVTVEHKAPKEDWVTIAPQSTYTWVTPDHNCSGNCPWYAYVNVTRVPVNQRFSGATPYSHSGPGCGWTRNQRVEIQEGGHALVNSVEVQGSPCTHRYAADLQELKVVGEDTGSTKYDLAYDKNLVVEMPPATTYWRLVGTSATLNPIDIVMVQDAGPLVFRSQTGGIQDGTPKRVTYYAKPPTT